MTLKDIIIAGKLTISEGGGGGGDFATGVINEAENTYTATINTGGDYDHFVMYAETDVSGHEVRALRVIVADFSVEKSTLIFFTTNNGGTAVGSQGYYVANLGVTKSGSIITYKHTGSWLIAGVNYRWVAW